MHIPKSVLERTKEADIVNKLKEGIRYVKQNNLMRSLFLLLAIVSFSNASLKTLAPIFAKDILKGGAHTLGFLMSSAGIGAICGALFLTRDKSTRLLKKIISFTGILLGTGMICFAISRSLALSLSFIAITGFSQMMHTACTNTLLQLHVDNDKHRKSNELLHSVPARDDAFWKPARRRYCRFHRRPVGGGMYGWLLPVRQCIR